MYKFRNFVLAAVLTGSVLPMTGCDQNFTDPATIVEEKALQSADGLIALASGLQYRYSVGRQSPVYTSITGSGFSSLEFRLMNAGNADEDLLSRGKANVDGRNSIIRQLWLQNMLVMNEANKVLANSGNIPDANVRAGVNAYAGLFKGLAIGTLAQFFEKLPVTIGAQQPFVDRTQALQEAIKVLETAETGLNGITLPTAFTSKVPNSIDLKNALPALIARYALMAGDHDKALAAAGRVDLTKKSSFKYDATNKNPIADVSILSNNVFQARDMNFGLPATLAPDAADKRIAFWLSNKSTDPAKPDPRVATTFYNAVDGAPPVYLPGEILLIKAEAYARKNDLANATTELNKVLTKKGSADAWGLGADLPAYAGANTQAALLTEIYKNRCIELYMSGMKLEDSRRFGRPDPNNASAERNRSFYPYPFDERDNNPNTPADPAI